MTRVLMRSGEETQRPSEEGIYLKTEPELECCVCKPGTPRTARSHQSLEELGKMIPQSLRRECGPADTGH